ncbi:MAG TPA: AarF/ABC1/UbiB kinase family protein, partial [Candidatus Binatia bacterium]|nr:AarF/ABC1/UbiB kinase family protein [Candidatus Binatia bacterium]
MSNGKKNHPSRSSRVPAGRLERLVRMGTMAGTVAAGALGEAARRWWSGESASYADVVLNVANAERIADTLSRMRGAAMKLGQLLSLEGGTVLPQAFTDALTSLQASGDRMSPAQLHGALGREYGHGWRDRFSEFEEEPFATASIGQVHRARARDGRDVALKIQFPGVAKSIASDVDNLAVLLRTTGIVPRDYDLTPLIETVKVQLRHETDYKTEAESLTRYGKLVKDEPTFVVPRPYDDLTTHRILAMEFIAGEPINDLWKTETPRRVRDRVGRDIQRLVFRELFEFRFMQSDPNFANYLQRDEGRELVLLDFGSTVEISAELSERYRRLLKAATADDHAKIAELVVEYGWLSAEDRWDWVEGLADLVLLGCEPLRVRGAYDFGASDLAERVQHASMKLAFERGLKRPPPPELVFIQRKLAGT